MSVDIIWDWAEVFGFLVLVAGFILALMVSPFYAYVLIVLVGLMFGRLMFRWERTFKVPLYVILLGFLVGFLIGAYRANTLVLIVLYFGSIYVSYLVHQKQLLKSIEF